MEARRVRNAIPTSVIELARRLGERGHRAWVVGGSLRDLLLAEARGESAISAGSDWDIATDARPEEVMRVFSRVIPTGIKHGTVTVLMGGASYEVTTLRGETTYSDGRRPDAVHFVDDIDADLARRDFTINAMAYDLAHDRLMDPFGGMADIAARVLRAVGDPAERFAEDGLRVLRAARFVATLDVALDAATERAIEPSLASYRKVSAERIRDEWTKAMKAERPSRAFDVMKDHGLLAITAPELLESVGCEQNRHHAYDVWGHAMHCLDGCPMDAGLRLAGLLHDIGKPRSRQWSDKTNDFTFYEHERIGAEMVHSLLDRLRFSNDERTRITALVRHHLVCYDSSWTDAAVRRWLRRVGPDLAPELYALNRADVLAKGRDAAADLERIRELEEHVAKVVRDGAALTVRALAIDGHDLAKMGLRPGPVFGEIFRILLDEVVEDPSLNDRDRLLARAREIAERRD